MTHTSMVLWLLRHAGIAAVNQPLVGDLLEEAACGRSTFWLWRQTFAIIARAALTDLRGHKLIALRAILTGLLVVYAATAVKFRITAHVQADSRAMFWLLTLSTFLLAGWVVGATHRDHKLATGLAFLSYAAVARTFLYSTHFDHYWKTALSYQFFQDSILTVLSLLLILIGAFLPSPAHREPDAG